MAEEEKVKITTDGVVNTIKAKFKAHPIKTVSALIAVPAALIAMISQGIALYNTMNTYIDDSFVSPEQLKETEDRITTKFHDEAIIIRGVYLADLIEQKTKLNELIKTSDKLGEIRYYTIQIEALNKKIDTLRGSHQ